MQLLFAEGKILLGGGGFKDFLECSARSRGEDGIQFDDLRIFFQMGGRKTHQLDTLCCW